MQSVNYPREKIIEVLRTLNELIVSLDRIRAGTVDQPKDEHDAALADFIINHNISRKAANARSILSEPFPNELGPDDMGELEREMEAVDYWSSRNRE